MYFYVYINQFNVDLVISWNFILCLTSNYFHKIKWVVVSINLHLP